MSTTRRQLRRASRPANHVGDDMHQIATRRQPVRGFWDMRLQAQPAATRRGPHSRRKPIAR